MKEKNILRFSILFYWTFFWGLSVLDKIIPDVHHLWVGKDFFALFVKFFGSLGLKDPIFATIALAFVSSLEGLNFVFYLLANINFLKRNESQSQKWFFRGIFTSITLFSLFSIADQVFGDRFQLMCGVDTLAVESLLMGASGWVAGLVCAFPRETVAIYRLIKAGRVAEAIAIYRWFLPLLELDINPQLVQNIKLAEEKVNLGSEIVRPPRLPLSGERRSKVLHVIESSI